MLDTLTSHKLQNWNGLKAISQQGLVPQSLSLFKYMPGSPEPDSSIRFHKLIKNSLVILCLISTAELLALPRCGLFSHQLPDLQDIISSSWAENKDIRAARLIPPASTASAIWQTISCTSNVCSFPPSFLPSSIPLIFNKHSFKGWGPGAFPPDVTSLAPFALISE